MPKNENATIYLLEDINDNRYVGSTGEKRLENRLSTHKRDEREHLFDICNRNCSSMKLNLHNCAIIPLMTCKNNSVERKKWERHFINNVYPECVNQKKLTFDRKEYYENNREEIKQKQRAARQKNKEEYNRKNRERYHKNKERILKRRKELQEMKRLENL